MATHNGTPNNDILLGGSGNDILRGGNGDDALYGGAGNDLLDGGFDFDRIDGEAGYDTVSYTFYDGRVDLSLRDGVVRFPGNADPAFTDTLVSIEAVYTGIGRDVIRGDDGDNYLNADYDSTAQRNANDTVYGLGGDDTIDGGWGFDYLDGGSGFDLVDYGFFGDSSGTTIDLVRERVSFASKYSSGGKVDTIVDFEGAIGGGGNDTFIGDSGANYFNGGHGRDTARGGGGNDRLFGAAGNDSLSGGSGNDRLTGMAGADVLTGGSGGDRFALEAPAHSGIGGTQRDQVRDFSASQGDRVDVSAIDANPAIGGNQAFSFVAAFSSNATGQLRFDAERHLVLGSTDSDSAAEFSIFMAGVDGMTGTNFIL